MRLIDEWTRETEEASMDYTVDGVIVVDDDTAYAIGYDAADSTYAILEGTRNDEGICYSVHAAGYSHEVSAESRVSSNPLFVAAERNLMEEE